MLVQSSLERSTRMSVSRAAQAASWKRTTHSRRAPEKPRASQSSVASDAHSLLFRFSRCYRRTPVADPFGVPYLPRASGRASEPSRGGNPLHHGQYPPSAAPRVGHNVIDLSLSRLIRGSVFVHKVALSAPCARGQGVVVDPSGEPSASRLSEPATGASPNRYIAPGAI